LVVLSFFFVTFLRGARFKQQQKDFVNMISHELKLPMSSIQMFAQTLRQKEPGPEERARFLDAILNDCARMNMLLNHLLKSQLIERGKLPVSLRRIDMLEFLTAFTARWPRPLGIRAESGAEAQADPMLLDLALTNLVNNAEKYGRGSVPELSLEADEKSVRISVKDLGAPIPRKYAKRIFERFFRLPPRGKRRQSGVGLGLYIVKSIARLHSGSIVLESGLEGDEGGKGNRFTLIFPRLK